MAQFTVLGAVDDLGRLHVYPGAPPPNAGFRGGLGFTASQRVAVTNAPTTNFVNGFMVADDGSLAVDTIGAAIYDYYMGFPRTILGMLVGQVDVIPNANDPYVNGVRVGPLGGIYATSALPV
jgi:hypothetical protein